MILPPETLNCFDIPPVRAGWVRLRPLTLADVALLARAGIDVLGALTADEAEAVFALLAGNRESGIGNRESGIGNRESGIGNKVANSQIPIPKSQFPTSKSLFPIPKSLLCTRSQRILAVRRALDIAFRNAVPGHSEGKTVNFTQRGYGWPLEIAEWLMHEYGMGFGEAAAMPLVRVYSLLAAARIRNGGKAGGPDYWDRATIAAMKEAKAHG